MGRIACNYYVDCSTMSYFMSNLNAYTKQIQFLYHLAQASEFKQLEARKEEHEELKYLCQDVQFVEIDRACFNEAHTKVLVLLECYLRKIPVKTFSLISDMAYVAQNVARLIRAMFEIALQKNFANLAKIALNWCKIIDKRLTPNDHAMKQFCLDSSFGKLTNASEKVTKYGYLKDEIVYRLKQFDITLDMINDKELNEAKRFLPPAMQDDLYKFASYIPYFDIEVVCQPITRAILKVQVTLVADFEWNDRWNGKSEPFWIMVDNETEILHSEFFMLHKKDVRKTFTKLKNEEGVSLTFFIPYEVQEGETRIGAGQYYNLTLLSDRWYDISYYKEINLGELDVPDEDFPSTKLLQLRPMSIRGLGNDKFEALYEEKFKFFNPVQTQVFHTLYHTDSNVLIGAPTGSGKTIMAELAMLRVFKNTP
jgi:replicative superfamily II helicase